jgi:hypothetical protein
MKRIILCYVVLFLFVGAIKKTMAAEVDGRWVIHWDNNTSNFVNFKSDVNNLSGEYVDDHGNKCSVDGVVKAAALVEFIVRCKGWKARCEGELTENGKLNGKYETDYKEAGKFQMIRQQQ